MEAEREKTKAFMDLAREGMNNLKDYPLRKVPRVTLPAYVLIGIVVIAAILSAWLGRVSGKTFTFLMGTFAGYIILLLSTHL